jgi:iron complex outermembrane recepter protein
MGTVMRTHLLCAASILAISTTSTPVLATHQENSPSDRQNILSITISKGSLIWPLGSGLFNKPSNADRGSLTSSSINAMQKELSRTAGSVDLVPAEEYTDSYAVSFKDMLDDVPGVFAEQRYAEESRLSIRGSGLGRGFHLRGIQLLQDGMLINFADGSGDFQELDPLTVRFLEVYKGSNGLRYGASTLGGAINSVTPTGHTAPAANQLRLEAGSYDTYRTHGSMARVYDDFDFYAAATGTTSNGYRDQSDTENGRLSGNIGYRFNERLETRFYAAYNNINQEVPGTLSLQDALNSARSAPTVNKTNNYARDIRSLRFANKTSVQLDDTTLVDTGAYVQFKELFHPISTVVDQESVNYGIFGRLVGETNFANHRNAYTLGFNAKFGATDAKSFANVGGSRGNQTAANDQNAANYDLYAENQFYLRPDLAFIAGGQFVYAVRDFTNRFNPSNNAFKDYVGFNPKVGLLWDVQESLQLFGNVSHSYEPPTFSELVQTGVTGYVPLDAQTAWTVEFGSRGHFWRTAFDATYYRSWVENELLNFTTGADIPASTFNANDTLHQGIELGFDLDIGAGWLFAENAKDKLILRQIYNWSNFTFVGDRQYGNNRIAAMPEHQYKATLRYESSAGWHISPAIEWVPSGAYADHANRLKAPGYAVVDMAAGYDLGNGAELFLDARNLLDKNYLSNMSAIRDASLVSTNVFYPGEGRSFFFGLKYMFE